MHTTRCPSQVCLPFECQLRNNAPRHIDFGANQFRRQFRQTSQLHLHVHESQCFCPDQYWIFPAEFHLTEQSCKCIHGVKFTTESSNYIHVMYLYMYIAHRCYNKLHAQAHVHVYHQPWMFIVHESIHVPNCSPNYAPNTCWHSSYKYVQYVYVQQTTRSTVSIDRTRLRLTETSSMSKLPVVRPNSRFSFRLKQKRRVTHKHTHFAWVQWCHRTRNLLTRRKPHQLLAWIGFNLCQDDG